MWLVAVVLLAACGSEKKDGAATAATGTPCEQLIAREMKCDYKKHASFDASAKKIFTKSCEDDKAKPGMAAALSCLKVDEKDCAGFLTCRTATEQMEGGH